MHGVLRCAAMHGVLRCAAMHRVLRCAAMHGIMRCATMQVKPSLPAAAVHRAIGRVSSVRGCGAQQHRWLAVAIVEGKMVMSTVILSAIGRF
jgi:hypothetical protein